MELVELRARVRGTIADPTLTYRQRLHRLAGLAEEAVEPPPVSDACREAQEKGVICPGTTRTFLGRFLRYSVELTAELMEARIRHLVEVAGFYRHDWLDSEGLIGLDRFSAMFGVYGLAEAVDALLER